MFNNKLLKLWCLTIIERIIPYGAGIGGGKLKKQVLTKFTSVQCIFHCEIAQGYKTISSNPPKVLTAIATITIT